RIQSKSWCASHGLVAVTGRTYHAAGAICPSRRREAHHRRRWMPWKRNNSGQRRAGITGAVTVLVFAALAVLVGSVAWRPHGLGPALGALAAVALAAAGGAVHGSDVPVALGAQWRAYVTLAAVMTMTSAAERMRLLERLAAIIEPRTRGPVRHAFRVTFVLSAVMASVLSNDAAILLMTPTVLVLLRTVYPRRNPKFLVAFSVAVFASAGVA